VRLVNVIAGHCHCIFSKLRLANCNPIPVPFLDPFSPFLIPFQWIVEVGLLYCELVGMRLSVKRRNISIGTLEEVFLS